MTEQQTSNMGSQGPGQGISGKNSPSSITNPRRCSPEASVSLRPYLKAQNRFQASAAQLAQEGPDLHTCKTSGTSTSHSSANRWFRQNNEDVTSRADGLLHEPPFYLNTQPNEESNSDVEETGESIWPAGGGLTSRDSENADLRDVIDDLTVENRQLKERLMRYEKTRRADLNQGKLFELHVHGLSANKKKDLEDLLTDFVTKVNMKDRRNLGAASSTNNSNVPSTTSKSRRSRLPPIVPDSGYGSTSASATGAKTTSGLSASAMGTAASRDEGVSSKSRNSNVRSYLHNIPESLLPRVSPVMSERQKKKLVVKRLEFIFSGTSAAPGPHSQPMQQQEVSNSAAQEGRLQPAGSREARIMVQTESPPVESSTENLKPQTSSDSDDQRPTRPLDLDVYRAQVPADNMEYIRHLGLESPTQGDGRSDGWVYLNLLMNMAQLHTLNVTPEFIKTAVSEMSEKFELSSDGRKVRWRGGNDATRFSSDGGSSGSALSGNSPDESQSSEPRESNVASQDDYGSKHASKSSSLPKPSGLASEHMVAGNGLERSSSLMLQSSKSSGFRPGGLRQQSSTEDSQYLGNDQSLASAFAMDDNFAQSSSNDRSQGGPSLRSSRSDRAIIFYKDALFCTDLTGNYKATTKSRPFEHGDHTHVLGMSSEDCASDSEIGFSAAASATPYDQINLAVERIQPLQLVPLSDVSEIHQDFQEFPVSGLGGVVPQDNFLIDVRTRHSLRPASARTESSGKARKNYDVVATSKLDLPPSRLPPASYMFMPIMSSSSGEDADVDSDEEGSNGEYERIPPTIMMQTSSNSYEDEGETDNEDDDSSSIDMLGAARAADPEAVAEQERLYDEKQMDGIITAQILLGSSAATAGGGSGDEMSLVMGSPNLKRGRSTLESLATESSSRSPKTQRRE